MSFGLAFAQGLVGGFTKNIEREQIKRDADDQRLAGLQDMLFQGTIKSAQDGTPMPQQIGDMLKKAKEDIANRPNIGPFGRGKADPLNLDFDKLSGVVNGVGASYFELGELKIPMNPLYAKEKNLGNRAKLFLESINKYASVPEQLKLMKKQLGDKSVATYFDGVLTTEKGLYKALIGKAATPSGAATIVSIPMVGGNGNQFSILSEFDYLKKVDVDGTEQTINVARDKLFGKEGTGVFEKNRKSHLVLPFKTSDGKNDFFSFKLESNDMQALQRIAEINGEKDSSVFISKFRKSIGRASPTLTNLETSTIDNEELRKFFPSVFHAIELEKLGASLNLSEINQEEKQQILNYLDTKIGLNIGDRVRALTPLMKLEKNQQVSLIQSIEGFSSPTGGDLAEKDKFFFDAVGLSQKDFDEKFLATEATTNDLDDLMSVEGNLNTTPGGLVRTLQQFFGSITVTTGVADQLSNIFSSGKNKDDVTEESLMERVQKIKNEPGNNIASALADMSKSESIMIALAANMARAVDPSGRLSNQDFEVQLRRLGASGFFRSKIAQVSQLQNVMSDFKGRLERIKMIKKVRDDAKTRNFNSREFQILNANSKLDNLMGGLQAGESTAGGIPKIVYDEGLTFDSNKFVGPNGEVVIQKRSPNKENHYFIGGKRVDPNTLRKKGAAVLPAPNKENNNKIKNNKTEVPSSSTSVKGTYLSGNNVDGMTLVDPDGNKLPGLYIQRNGKFVLKPEGEGA